MNPKQHLKQMNTNEHRHSGARRSRRRDVEGTVRQGMFEKLAGRWTLLGAEARAPFAVLGLSVSIFGFHSFPLTFPFTRPADTLSPSDGERAGVRGISSRFERA
jgi:hypothetical protein